MTITIQKLSRSRNLVSFATEQKALVPLSFPSVLKNGTSWMIKSEIYHPFLDSKNCFLICFKTDENSIFDVHNSIGIKLLNRLTV